MKEPVVTDPIPDGVIYKPESAEGEKSAIEFSINGGDTYQSWPPVYRIKNNAGEIIEKEASPDMITHIRWTVKEALAPMRSKKLEFEVIVK